MTMNSSKCSWLILAIILLAATRPINAQNRSAAKTDKDLWRYEIECVGTGIEGTAQIKVWSYSKKPELAAEQAKKNAIHGIIFKGFSGGAQGCTSQKPLARDPNIEQTHEKYFKAFFSASGSYMKYVTLTNDGNVPAGNRLKVSKKLYKVGVIVSVRRDELRKSLENAGVIKALSAGF